LTNGTIYVIIVVPREKERNLKMAKVKMVCFDMDGTIADLYGVNGWLEMLREENPTPYKVAEPMWDMAELHMVLNALQKQGIEVRIVTWLSMNSTEDYKAQTRKAKMEWLEKYNFPYDNFHGIAYGTTKANAIRKYLAENEQAILIDDNDKIRQGWNVGETINPTKENIIEILKNLLN
jgi:phosphoglycolate phosphatase-like HAD superfamily hydrolase